MESNQMTERLGEHFGDSVKTISIRQTRRGCFQEIILGCEASDEFKWFQTTDGRNDQFATSLEESNCCMRVFCGGCHKFDMVVKEDGTGNEILHSHRPMRCNTGPCKCCCFQTMEFSVGGQELGDITEQFWCCVPRMLINDSKGNPIYKVHNPTCCGGMCVNCCYEGNPCGKGCCKVSYQIFPADQEDTDNGAPSVGQIMKVPKSLMVEFFSDAEAYDVTFPEQSTAEQKALIAGSVLFINANFFEGEDDAGAGA